MMARYVPGRWSGAISRGIPALKKTKVDILAPKIGWQARSLAAFATTQQSESLSTAPDEGSFKMKTSPYLTDKHSRHHSYLRISVTERCNLRCTYCMPEEGVPLSPSAHLLTTPEIVYLSSLFVHQGVTKIRLTGGEPTIRKDILSMMHQIGALQRHGLRELCITTNGIALHRKLDSMADAGLTGINLSLDTLDPWQFQIMTRRKGLEAVLKSVDRILEMNDAGAKIKLKINCVVMRGVNDREILDFVELGREKDVEVRFIEYMPFDGNRWSAEKMLGYKEMLACIQERYPDVRRVQQESKSDTSKTYKVPGFVGQVGFITSMTHNFCGNCNRLRITSDGNLKVCLFGNAEVSLRDLLREDHGGKPIDEELMETIKRIELDQRQAIPGPQGYVGFGKTEAKLLELIGAAVKRKKAKHAGLGQLEHMPNRPMILIDDATITGHLNQTRQLNGLGTMYPTWNGSMQRLSLSTQPVRLASSKATSRQSLPHLARTSEAHMISVSNKEMTHRVAMAASITRFTQPGTLRLIEENALRKGDVLAVARIAAIQAVKKTADLIPLCHSGLNVEGVQVRLIPIRNGSPSTLTDPNQPDTQSIPNNIVDSVLSQDNLGPIDGILAIVQAETTAKTGVEMEALTGAVGAALTVIDMVKSVDRGALILSVRVVGKRGGRSAAQGVYEDNLTSG